MTGQLGPISLVCALYPVRRGDHSFAPTASSHQSCMACGRARWLYRPALGTALSRRPVGPAGDAEAPALTDQRRGRPSSRLAGEQGPAEIELADLVERAARALGDSAFGADTNNEVVA
jgi:hypothetical protein